MAVYFIFQGVIKDAEKLNNEYLPKAMETMASYELEVLVAEDNPEVIEGQVDLPRTVVLKFKSRDEAKAWYNSPDYQAIVGVRLEAAPGTAILVDEFAPPS